MPISIPFPGSDGTNVPGGPYNAMGTPSNVCQYAPLPTPLIDVDSETDSNHDTALTLACAGGHDELVQLLLTRGANIGEFIIFYDSICKVFIYLHT